MLDRILAYALLAFSFIACLAAFARGGTPERLGAGAILLNLFAGMSNEVVFRDQTVALAIDAVTAAVLLPIAIRYLSGWLGVVMILYGLEFALHAYYAVLNKPRDLLHAQLNNLDFFAISGCLAFGVAVAWRRRVKLAGLEP